MPVTALETGLYNKLSTAGDLITELGGTFIYNSLAAQGVNDTASDKYVVFQWQGGGDDNKTPSRARSVLYTVYGVGLTPEAAAAIDGYIDAALHDQTLTITGWTNYWTARESDINFVETDSQGITRHRIGGIYRIRSENV